MKKLTQEDIVVAIYWPYVLIQCVCGNQYDPSAPQTQDIWSIAEEDDRWAAAFELGWRRNYNLNAYFCPSQMFFCKHCYAKSYIAAEEGRRVLQRQKAEEYYEEREPEWKQTLLL